MALVNKRLAAALRARLNGESARLNCDDEVCGLPAVKAAQVAPWTAAQAAAEVLGLELVERLSDHAVSHEFIARVPISFARRHCMIGLASTSGPMTVAMADVGSWPQYQAVARLLTGPLRPVLSPPEEILRAINGAYQQQGGAAQQVIEQLDASDVMRQLEAAPGNEDLLDTSGRAPVIKLVNLVLFEAIRRRASDVHVQPQEGQVSIRMRVDGALHDVYFPPKSIHPEIISRIKVMGGMNIAEHRLPQDGRATVEVGDRMVDLRIATLPTTFGEQAVIRLLDKGVRLYELGELGMPEACLERFRRLIHSDHGIILVTGPTGSGKSTTLYAALREINARDTNIITLEDPIEYRLEGISQTQVSDRKGMTFASGLRHVLRQDPDVIMLGEIRDAETARMAMQSSLTGHLVFSTLHTNDAAGAVARMLDLGVEPYLLASSLLGVLAQRLVRRVCPRCAVAFSPRPGDLKRWNVRLDDVPAGMVAGRGCEHCMNTGYRERIGIFELLTVTEPVRELMLQCAKASSIKAQAVSADRMTTLRADGVAKVAAGITTMDEVSKVTGRDEF